MVEKPRFGHGALPSIPRDTLQRIQEAERDARARYDCDKMPYFPTAPDFSFLENDIFNSMRHILDYIRIFAEEVLAAGLTEYLNYAPLQLLSDEDALQSIWQNVATLTDELWIGYKVTLWQEPASRAARYAMAIATETPDRRRAVTALRYPNSERWADFIKRMGKSDSEIARFDEIYQMTMLSTCQNRTAYFQAEAAARLGMNPDQAQPSEEVPLSPNENCAVPSKAEQTSEKGNVAILRGTDGNLKNAVTLDTARRFGGVTKRAVEKAAEKGALESQGSRANRRIIVASLLKYFPPESSAT